MAKKASSKTPKTSKAAKPKASKTPTAASLSKQTAKEEVERLKNSREYAELNGLLTQEPHKKIATLEWLNKSLPEGEAPIAKATPKEKERFILALLRKGKAQAVIDDLRDLPTRRWKTLFAELADLSPAKAKEKVTDLGSKDFPAFCAANGIAPVTSGKGSISKPKTLPLILKKLENLSEYLKL